MYTNASFQGWLHAIGGWPNLLQGLLSAAIAGIVAAAVSFIVVYLTNAGARRLSRHQEARDRLVRAVEATIDTFVGIPDSRDLRQDLEDSAVLAFKLKLAAALIAEQDRKFAQRIENIAGQLARIANSWQDRPGFQKQTNSPNRFNEAYAVVSPLQEEIINWLGNVKPVYRDGGDSAPVASHR
jgi:hypothetical protein